MLPERAMLELELRRRFTPIRFALNILLITLMPSYAASMLLIRTLLPLITSLA